MTTPSVSPLVVLHQDNGLLAEFFTQRQIPFVAIDEVTPVDLHQGVLKTLQQSVAAAPALLRFLRTHSIDIVHTNDQRMHRTWIPATLASRRPHVWHQRSAWYPSLKASLFLRSPNSVICISEYVRNTLPEWAASRSFVLMNPFSTKELAERRLARQNLEAELNVASGTRIVTFVGNLREQKRPEVFVRAASLLAEQYRQPLVFLMVGERRENLQDELEHLMKNKARLIFLGYRPAEPVIAASDVLITPAVSEAHSRIVIESMLLGTPVVAANSGGHPESISHEGVGTLVEPDVPEAFAAATLRLLQDSALWASVSQAAQLHARSLVSVENHTAQMMDIYRRLLRIEAPTSSGQ